MTVPTLTPGSPCWFELATTDQLAAKTFYKALFGWTVNDSPMAPGQFYSMFTLDGREVGAACAMRPEQRSQGVPPNWLVYVSVADADATVSRAAALGGTVFQPPFDVFDLGRMSVLGDPAGAVFAIWQPKQHAGIAAWNEPDAPGWVDISVADQATAGRFYSELFGWRMVAGRNLAPAAPGTYFHIAHGDTLIGGVPSASERAPDAPPHWLTYFSVASCADATARAISLGGRAWIENMNVGNEGWISVVCDAQGATFGLHSLAP